MPRRCTICTHKSRPKIDQALLQRQPFRAIARQYSVSKDALIRHHDDHLPAALVKAQEATEAAQAEPRAEAGVGQGAVTDNRAHR